MSPAPATASTDDGSRKEPTQGAQSVDRAEHSTGAFCVVQELNGQRGQDYETTELFYRRRRKGRSSTSRQWA